MNNTIVYIGSNSSHFISILIGPEIDATFLIKNMHFIDYDYNLIKKIALSFASEKDFVLLKEKWQGIYKKYLEEKTKLL